MRITSQRREILRVVRESADHPTAAEVYQRVRCRLPRISLGTVYRNLERLCQKGEIRRVQAPGREMRFDGDSGVHYHLRCTCCGRVVDVDRKLVDVDVDCPEKVDGVEVTGWRLQLLGRCPECLNGEERKGE